MLKVICLCLSLSVSFSLYVCVYVSICPRVCVCRNVVLLDFNHILPVGLHCLESVATDNYIQRVDKMKFRHYWRTEAEYVSVSYYIAQRYCSFVICMYV